MLLKNILKKQNLEYLSWQFIFYHLKYEKGFKVNASDIKNNNLKTPIIEYLHSKEFEEVMYRDIEYNTREKLILENKERIINYVKIDKNIQRDCAISYYTVCSTIRYLKSRFDISIVLDTDRRSSLAHILPVLAYIIHKTKTNGDEKNMSSTKMYQIDLKKLLLDLDIIDLTKKEQAEKLGFSTYTVYVNVTLNNNRLTKRSVEIIANAIAKYNLNVNDYLIGDTISYANVIEKPIKEECNIYEPKITNDTQEDYLLQEKLYEDASRLKNITNDTQEHIILNQLSEILEIIRAIINK